MTDSGDLEEQLDEIDAEIEELTTRSSGFDFVAEVSKLRAALMGRKERPGDSSQRASSRHDRIERIKELQRKREQIIRELAEQRNESPEEHPDS